MTITRACTICGQPTHGPRCPQHGGNRRQMTTTQRGYGYPHQQARAQLIETASGMTCPICKQPIWPHEGVDLHHETPMIDDPTPRPGDTIVHAKCNRASMGRGGQRS